MVFTSVKKLKDYLNNNWNQIEELEQIKPKGKKFVCGKLL